MGPYDDPEARPAFDNPEPTAFAAMNCLQEPWMCGRRVRDGLERGGVPRLPPFRVPVWNQPSSSAPHKRGPADLHSVQLGKSPTHMRRPLLFALQGAPQLHKAHQRRPTSGLRFLFTGSSKTGICRFSRGQLWFVGISPKWVLQIPYSWQRLYMMSDPPGPCSLHPFLMGKSPRSGLHVRALNQIKALAMNGDSTAPVSRERGRQHFGPGQAPSANSRRHRARRRGGGGGVEG